jgi:hypothetical protein
MLSALPLTAILVAFVANIVVSFVIKYGITENRIVRGTAQLVATSIIGFVMTQGLVNFLIVATVPIWGAIVTILAVVLLMLLLSLLILAPLAKAGYLGNHQKWALELKNDDEFQAAVKLLDKKQVREIANMSADKEHFRNQVVEEAGINAD